MSYTNGGVWAAPTPLIVCECHLKMEKLLALGWWCLVTLHKHQQQSRRQQFFVGSNLVVTVLLRIIRRNAPKTLGVWWDPGACFSKCQPGGFWWLSGDSGVGRFLQVPMMMLSPMPAVYKGVLKVKWASNFIKFIRSSLLSSKSTFCPVYMCMPYPTPVWRTISIASS